MEPLYLEVCIILPTNIYVQILNKISDSNGRFILLHVIINNLELILANIYAPTKDKIKEQRAFVNYVHDTLVNFIDKTMVIGGDCNIYIDSKKDKSGGIEEVKSDARCKMYPPAKAKVAVTQLCHELEV